MVVPEFLNRSGLCTECTSQLLLFGSVFESIAFFPDWSAARLLACYGPGQVAQISDAGLSAVVLIWW
jgi:hypothetical protein